MSNRVNFYQRWEGKNFPKLVKGGYQNNYLIDLGCDKTCREEISYSEESCEDLSYLSEPSFQKYCPPLHATCTNTNTEPEPCECKEPPKKCKPLKPPRNPCKSKQDCSYKKSNHESDSSWSSYVKK